MSSFFPANYADALVVEGEGVRVAMRPLAANPSVADARSGKVVYSNAYNETDILNAVKPGHSQEFILLKSAAARSSFKYLITQLSEGAQVSLVNGELRFIDAQGRGVKIEKPVVIDANGQRMEDAMHWEIGATKANGKQVVTLALNSVGFAYPLAVDLNWSLANNFNIAPQITVANGGFETGDFTGWTEMDEAAGSGSWQVYSGTGFNGFAPPEGNFAAESFQGGPGSHILYRDLMLPAGMKHVLTFFIYLENFAGNFVTPATLDYNSFPNQQYRVDLITTTADPFSVASGDVLANLYQTQVGSPTTVAPTMITADISAFAGSTVRLRFAEVDDESNFYASFDDVQVQSTPLQQLVVNGVMEGGTRGKLYRQAVTASKGTAPYSFTISQGALPPGLTISGSGTINGMGGAIISGVPSTSGTFNFTVQANDVNGLVGSHPFSIIIK